MKIHKEKEFKKAMTKTLHAYEELIEDTRGNVKKWDWYGFHSSCRVCKVYKVTNSNNSGCMKCPLNNMSNDSKTTGCVTDVGKDFKYYIFFVEHTRDYESIRRSAKARYDELIKHLDKYDLEYR